MGAEGLIVDAVLPQGGGQLESEQFQTDALEGNGQVSSSFNLFVSEDTQLSISARGISHSNIGWCTELGC